MLEQTQTPATEPVLSKHERWASVDEWLLPADWPFKAQGEAAQ